MGYTQINMDVAKSIFEVPGEYIILDVRRAEEFSAAIKQYLESQGILQ